MEFSWNYSDTMRRLVRQDGFRCLTGSLGIEKNYPIILTFDLDPNGVSEVPTFCWRAASSTILKLTEPVTIVLPLTLDTYQRTIAGAEPMLKHFSRHPNYNGRICRVDTTKGETYYGEAGLIFDKDFNPLLLSTAEARKNPDTGYIDIGKTSVYLSPKVFLDDQAILNKSLAKKGIAYYLSHNVGVQGFNEARANVIINDMSKFFRKVARPDINASSTDDFNKVLKDNIDEVLKQFYNDMSRGD